MRVHFRGCLENSIYEDISKVISIRFKWLLKKTLDLYIPCRSNKNQMQPPPSAKKKRKCVHKGSLEGRFKICLYTESFKMNLEH